MADKVHQRHTVAARVANAIDVGDADAANLVEVLLALVHVEQLLLVEATQQLVERLAVVRHIVAALAKQTHYLWCAFERCVFGVQLRQRNRNIAQTTTSSYR